MSRILRQHRVDLLAALAYLVLPFFLFASVTFGGKTLVPADNLFFIEPWASAKSQFNITTPHNDLVSDLLLENYAWKNFVVDSLKNGELPLWNPYQFAGVPFLATGQHSALYPFSILFYILPIANAYGWFIVSQFFLAGLFAYIFLRSLGQSKFAAFIGGLIYEFSLFMIVSVVFVMIIAGAVWLPLILACVEWIVRQRPALGGRPSSLPWVMLGGVALGFQILAGHPEVVYYTLLIAGAYSAFRLLAISHQPSAISKPQSLISNLSRPSIYLLAMVMLGVALGAVQLLPLFEVTSQNFRVGSATLDQVRGWAFPVRHILAFFVPNIFGNPSHHTYFDLFTQQWTVVSKNALGESITRIDWGIKNYVEGGAYLGILPLILAGFGIISIFKRSAVSNQQSATPNPQSLTAKIFFILLTFFSLNFIFGSPLYALIYYLPFLNQLHSPFRWVLPLSLAIAVLAGFGLDYIRTRNPKSPTSGNIRDVALPRLTDYCSLITIFTGIGTLATLIFLYFNFANYQLLITQLLNRLALANTTFADAKMFFSYEALWLTQFALIAIVSGLVLVAARRFGSTQIWLAATAVVIAGDLIINGMGFNASADPKILNYIPPVVQFLKQDQTLWRFTTFDPDGRKPFNANVGWLFDLYDVRGYDSIIPKQYADYMALIEPQSELQYNRIAPISNLQSLDSPLLDLLNVKYVISLVEINSPKYKLVYNNEVRVYENLGVTPRAFTLPIGCGMSRSDLADALRNYDPRHHAVFDSGMPPTPALTSSQCNPIPADISDYRSTEVSVSAAPPEPSFLILADSYSKDWRAFVRAYGDDPKNEKEISLMRVDGNFRAVKLDASERGWTVRFKYSPNSVKFGGFISVIAALTMALAIGMWLWRYFYRESAEDSTARRVAKNSIAPMALNLMNRSIDLIFAAFMLRLLGPADAGKYYFAGVVITWFEIWMNFGLNTYLTREVSKDHAHANRYLSNTTILRLLLGGSSFPVLALIMFLLARFSNLSGDTALAITLLAIGLIPSSISTGLTSLFYAYEKAEYPAAITTVTTLLKVTFGALALLLGYSFIGLSAVTIVVNTITMLILGFLVARSFFTPRVEFDRALQPTMIRESFPLMINHLLATLFFKVDVTLLQPIRGEIEVGWYSTAYKFIEAFNIIPSFFTFALFPVMSRQANEDRPALVRSYSLAVKLLITTAFPLAIITTFLSSTLIGLLAGDAYLPHGAIALTLMVWSIPVGWINSVTNYVLIALGQQRALTRAFIIGLTFNVIANLIFIPIYGYAAAAIITIFSEVIEGLPFYITLHKRLAPIPWHKILWKPALSCAIMFVLTWIGWGVHPLVGLAVGGITYLILVIVLRVFNQDEIDQFVSVLPSGIRNRLQLKDRVGL